MSSFTKMASQSRRRGSRGSAQPFFNSLTKAPLAQDIETPLPEDDPIRPLRNMADRVGKEVEKFAERLDHWYTHGNESAKDKYSTTLRLVCKFKDVADAAVKELKRQNEAERQGVLAKSVQRRIQHMGESPIQSVEEEGLNRQRELSRGPVEPQTAPFQEMRMWQAESATWDLLRILIDHHHPEPESDPAASKKANLAKLKKIHQYSPNTEIWDRFILEDDHAREKMIVLKWLRETAAETESDIHEIADGLARQSGKDLSVWNNGWLDTKLKIKHEKRLSGVDGPLGASAHSIKRDDRSAHIVNQLDPDARTRQHRTLEKSDDYYEQAIWMILYEMVRRGTPWDEIAEWCRERNEAWRAVSIGASYGSHPTDYPNLQGPTAGYLWRRMCFYKARGAAYRYEGGLYGLLSGDLKSAELVCRTWDDHLYARYNALVLSRFDNYLQKKFPQKVSSLSGKFSAFPDAVKALGSWEEAAALTIDSLKQQKTTAAQSWSPFKVIQGALIGRNFENVLIQLGAAIAQMLPTDGRHTNLIVDPSTLEGGPLLDSEVEQHFRTLAVDPQALRVAVHILIILRNGLFVSRPNNAAEYSAIDNVIAAYIEVLRVSRRMDLIPLYAAQFAKNRAAHCLGRIMPDINYPAEQKRFIDMVGVYSLDAVEAISEYYSCVLGASGLLDGPLEPIRRFKMLEPAGDELLWPGQRILKGMFEDQINSKEQAILDCVQWYIHLDAERSATFVGLADALKHFLLNGRIGAASKLVQELGVSAISLVKTPYYCGYAFDFTEPGAEEQDLERLEQAIRDPNASPKKRRTISPENHAKEVLRFRQMSETYGQMQQLITLIDLFRQWRVEEDKLMQLRNEGKKLSNKHIKELFDRITDSVEIILTSFLHKSSEGIPFSAINRLQDDTPEKERTIREFGEFSDILRAYVPECLIAYVVVANAASVFISRESATKALDLATVVADGDRRWIANLMRETGRLMEFVECLAKLSTAMLRFGETEDKGKKAGRKKRGWRGQTERIWEVGVGN